MLLSPLDIRREQWLRTARACIYGFGFRGATGAANFRAFISCIRHANKVR